MLYLALALLVLPVRWIFAAAFAAVFHELCHYAVVRLCGGSIRSVTTSLSGARMGVRGLSEPKELLCALAGPMGSLLLLLFVRWVPRIAVCAGFQGLYNLIPVYPLDGGRAVRCFANMIFPLTIAQRICDWVERACLIGIFGLGLYGCFVLRLGLLPLLVSVCAVLRIVQGKIPCKLWGNSVQYTDNQ